MLWGAWASITYLSLQKHEWLSFSQTGSLLGTCQGGAPQYMFLSSFPTLPSFMSGLTLGSPDMLGVYRQWRDWPGRLGCISKVLPCCAANPTLARAQGELTNAMVRPRGFESPLVHLLGLVYDACRSLAFVVLLGRRYVEC